MTQSGTESSALIEGRALSVSLTVADIESSLRWYHDVAGFSIAQKFEREGKLMAVSLRAGEVAILITQDDGAHGMDRTKGAGFSMRITTDQDIDDLARAIEQRGGVLDDQPSEMRWGQRVFRFRDPDGFRFVVSSERETPARVTGTSKVES